MKSFPSMQAALDSVGRLAIGQRVEVQGRVAQVVDTHSARTLSFSTSHQVSTSRPDDGRMYTKGSEVSTQYGR